MKRSHHMPFGAECLAGGNARFRLWAPAANRIDLLLASEDFRTLPMSRAEDGWFELSTAAGSGTRYFYQVNGETRVPDPASRFQPQDIHGASAVVDPQSFDWSDAAWNGRPWAEAVIYELHVGAFTQSGTFLGAIERLDYLVELGVTALELMPLSDFPGQRNWGYDGVLPYAPDSSYGRPEHLKTLIQAAHSKGLMVFLDVVYNHFGPEGNYLRAYAPQFFTDRHRTPWGEGINFDGDGSRVVRDYFIHNALYWLTEYHFDGLRLDAVDSIKDNSSPTILEELATRVHQTMGKQRHVHLVLENDRNQAYYLRRAEDGSPRLFTAQWNDDMHHAMHVTITGESDGYYADYAIDPVGYMARCLTEGFAYQGEVSDYRNGARRGEPSIGLRPTAFVSFLQNHDQIGNRPFGDRITNIADPAAVRAMLAILLLGPQPPLLFMGEEFRASTPFLFFCDFGEELGKAVTEGRRGEFQRFKRFNDPAERARIPDPNNRITFERSTLDWQSTADSCHRDWLDLYKHLLRLRHEHIVPRLRKSDRVDAKYSIQQKQVLTVDWHFAEGSKLSLLANLRAEAVSGEVASNILYATCEPAALRQGMLPPWSVVWSE
jgi:maltooligosyltrehalose trehalohydrolase